LYCVRILELSVVRAMFIKSSRNIDGSSLYIHRMPAVQGLDVPTKVGLLHAYIQMNVIKVV